MSSRTGVRILRATVGIEAEPSRLLPRFPLPVEVPSLLTDFREVVEIPYAPGLDGRIVLANTRSRRWSYSFSGRTAVLSGPLIAAESTASDVRYGVWGNQGFLYRFALSLLELRHGIFNFHAAGLYDNQNHKLFVVAGGAGSGKTVYLLSGIERGLKLFSTETVHFRFKGRRLTWFKGSLIDNVRLGTLLQDFPGFRPPGLSGRAADSTWQAKVALDLGRHQSDRDILENPDIVLVFPHIEQGRSGFSASPLPDSRLAAKAVFDNISEKIAESFILLDSVAIPGFDTAALAAVRWRTAMALVVHPTLRRIATVLSNPAACWGDLDRKRAL